MVFHNYLSNLLKGPNTGGMGAYAPTPIFTSALASEIMRTVLQPTIDGLRRSGMNNQDMILMI